jgi:hypothetical protein
MSPYGPTTFFNSGVRGEFRYDLGKYLTGHRALSTAAVVRRRVSGTTDTILGYGRAGSTIDRMELTFETTNKIRYGTRAGSEGLQNVLTDTTFTDGDAWYFVVATARIINGGGRYKIYVDGVEQPTTGTPNHSFDAFDLSVPGTTSHGKLGGIDYGLYDWSIIDMAFCYHWTWELTAADVVSLYEDPYQMFHRPDVTRYADVFLGGPTVSYYFVELPRNLGAQRIGGVTSMTIDAASEEIAKNLAAARFEGDSDWTQAEATLLEPLVTGAYSGTKFRVKITGKPVPSPDLIDVSYTADSDDNLGDVASGIVAAINATKEITSANWNTPNIVIPGAEGLGDRRIIVEITPPGAAAPITWTDGLPVKSITDGGASGADLKIEMADTGIPRILG